jgi:hypothetical protein
VKKVVAIMGMVVGLSCLFAFSTVGKAEKNSDPSASDPTSSSLYGKVKGQETLDQAEKDKVPELTTASEVENSAKVEAGTDSEKQSSESASGPITEKVNSNTIAKESTTSFVADYDTLYNKMRPNEVGSEAIVENSFLGPAQFFGLFGKNIAMTNPAISNVAAVNCTALTPFGTKQVLNPHTTDFYDINYIQNIISLAQVPATAADQYESFDMANTKGLADRDILKAQMPVGVFQEVPGKVVVGKDISIDAAGQLTFPNLEGEITLSDPTKFDLYQEDKETSHYEKSYEGDRPNQYIDIETELKGLSEKSVALAKMSAAAAYPQPNNPTKENVDYSSGIKISTEYYGSLKIDVSQCSSKGAVIHLDADILSKLDKLTISGIQRIENGRNNNGVIIVVDTHHNQTIEKFPAINVQYLEEDQSLSPPVTDIKDFTDNTLMWTFVNKDEVTSKQAETSDSTGLRLANQTAFKGLIKVISYAFQGTLLAPEATVETTANFAGGIIAKNISQKGQFQRWDFQGNIHPLAKCLVNKSDKLTQKIVATEDDSLPDGLADGMQGVATPSLDKMAFNVTQYEITDEKLASPLALIHAEQVGERVQMTIYHWQDNQFVATKKTTAVDEQTQKGSWLFSLGTGYRYVITEDVPPAGYELSVADWAINRLNDEDLANDQAALADLKKVDPTNTTKEQALEKASFLISDEGNSTASTGAPLSEWHSQHETDALEVVGTQTSSFNRLGVITAKTVVFDKVDAPKAATLSVKKYATLKGEYLGGTVNNPTATPNSIVAGMAFQVDFMDNPTQKPQPVMTLNVANNWQMDFKNQPDGEYQVYESKSPKGYQLSESRYFFTVKDGKIVDSFSTEQENADEKDEQGKDQFYWQYEYFPANYDRQLYASQHLVLHKFNEKKPAFQLKVEKYATPPAPKKQITNIDELTLTLTKGEEKPVELNVANAFKADNLSDGTYTIVETKAPQDYQLSDTRFVFTLSDGKIERSESQDAQGNPVASPDVLVVDKLQPILTFQKFDVPRDKVFAIRKFGGAADEAIKKEVRYNEAGNLAVARLAELEFTLSAFSNLNFTEPIVDDKQQPLTKTIKADGEGALAFTEQTLRELAGSQHTMENVDYRLTETHAPKGYEKISQSFYFNIQQGKLVPYTKNGSAAAEHGALAGAWQEPTDHTTSQKQGIYKVDNATYTKEKPNYVFLVFNQKTPLADTNVPLPHTGGEGNQRYLLVGIGLIVLAIAYGCLKKWHTNQQNDN